MVVELSLEVLWDFSAAHRARVLVLHMAAHALNAKAVAAWHDAGLDHEVEAQAAVCLDVLGLVLIVRLDDLLNVTSNEFELFVLDSFAFHVGVRLHFLLMRLLLISHHVSILVVWQCLGLAVLVHENDLLFNPVARPIALRLPLLDAFVQDDFREMLANIFLRVTFFYLLLNGLFEKFL